VSGLIYPFRTHRPRIDAEAFVAPNATIVGQVSIGKGSSIWYGAVLRADVCWIEIGERTSIQDNSVIHVTDETNGTKVGSDVTVGHRVVLHGCEIHDRCLIGMGSVVLDRAVVESDAMLAAGSLLPPNKRVKSGELWGGSPARFMRKLTEQEIAYLPFSSHYYWDLAKGHIEGINAG
jgi:carbonic anhydrase/acetyltransferase-like protein (isoleucine patch superfamily)